MSTPQPTEEELRAAYEAELKLIAVADVVVQTAVSLVNLAGRRMGLAPGSEDERDLEQVRDAIDSVRGLMPILERRGAPELRPIREALSQLQLAFARESAPPGAAEPGPPGAAEGATPAPGGPGSGAGAPGQGAGAGAPGQGSGDSAASEGTPGAAPGPAESSGRLWIPGR